jgi:hypothetical protein
MTIAGGHGRSTDWGDSVPVAPSVLIADAYGNPVAGVTVTWTTYASNETVRNPTATTGADGVASTGRWAFGVPTGVKTLTAAAPGVGGSPIDFVATAVDRSQAIKAGGYDQTTTAGTMVLDLPAIQVTVMNGTSSSGPLAGAQVTFVVDSGGGSITGGVATTDNYGMARIGSWTLGPQPGANKLSAHLAWPGAAVIKFTATGTP